MLHGASEAQPAFPNGTKITGVPPCHIVGSELEVHAIAILVQKRIYDNIARASSLHGASPRRKVVPLIADIKIDILAIHTFQS